MSPGFYFNPDEQDLEVFLGPTEAKLMEIAWKKKDITVKKAMFFLGDKNKLAYTTVMTVLARLADKGLLKRKKINREFNYQPALSREKFIKERLKKINSCLKQFKDSK